MVSVGGGLGISRRFDEISYVILKSCRSKRFSHGVGRILFSFNVFQLYISCVDVVREMMHVYITVLTSSFLRFIFDHCDCREAVNGYDCWG